MFMSGGKAVRRFGFYKEHVTMKTVLVNKAFNFRIYPTLAQEQILAQLFGA